MLTGGNVGLEARAAAAVCTGEEAPVRTAVPHVQRYRSVELSEDGVYVRCRAACVCTAFAPVCQPAGVALGAHERRLARSVESLLRVDARLRTATAVTNSIDGGAFD